MPQSERPHHLLFICTGNICSSPMAEGLALRIAKKLQRVVSVRSASILGISDYPADPNAIAVCSELGIDLSQHHSQALNESLINWADYILAMELKQAKQVQQSFPQMGERLLLLGGFNEHNASGEITDPIGGWKFRFRRTRDELSACLEPFIQRLPERN